MVTVVPQGFPVPRTPSPVPPPPLAALTTPHDTIDAEIVEEPASDNLPAVVDQPNAGRIAKDWVDHCDANDVKLSKTIIKRYAAAIKSALDQGFHPNLVKQALAQMLADSEASRPHLFEHFLVRVQQGPARRQRKLTPGEATAQRLTSGPDGGQVIDLMQHFFEKAAGQ
jgi:hypothetical protein